MVNVKLPLCLTNWALRHEDVLGIGCIDAMFSWPQQYLEVHGQFHATAASPLGRCLWQPLNMEAGCTTESVWTTWRGYNSQLYSICYDVIVIWWRRPLYHNQEDISVYFNAVPVLAHRWKVQTCLRIVRFVCPHMVWRALALTLNSGCCYPRFVRKVGGGGGVRLGSCKWQWKTFRFQQVYGRLPAGFGAHRKGFHPWQLWTNSVALSSDSQAPSAKSFRRRGCKSELLSREICFCHTVKKTLWLYKTIILLPSKMVG
jgi:hypothetical protein